MPVEEMAEKPLQGFSFAFYCDCCWKRMGRYSFASIEEAENYAKKNEWRFPNDPVLDICFCPDCVSLHNGNPLRYPRPSDDELRKLGIIRSKLFVREDKKQCGITYEMIYDHAKKYPTFNKERLIEWLKAEPYRWYAYKSVAEATKKMRKSIKLQKYIERC